MDQVKTVSWAEDQVEGVVGPQVERNIPARPKDLGFATGPPLRRPHSAHGAASTRRSVRRRRRPRISEDRPRPHSEPARLKAHGERHDRLGSESASPSQSLNIECAPPAEAGETATEKAGNQSKDAEKAAVDNAN